VPAVRGLRPLLFGLTSGNQAIEVASLLGKLRWPGRRVEHVERRGGAGTDGDPEELDHAARPVRIADLVVNTVRFSEQLRQFLGDRRFHVRPSSGSATSPRARATRSGVIGRWVMRTPAASSM